MVPDGLAAVLQRRYGTSWTTFTLNVLCNREVIAVDQDPLGQSARVVPLADETFLMVKDLDDGSKAVGLVNRGQYSGTSYGKMGRPGRGRRQHRPRSVAAEGSGNVTGRFARVCPGHRSGFGADWKVTSGRVLW